MDFEAPSGLETSLVEDELNALQWLGASRCVSSDARRDHALLIQMGQSYGSFDSGGKSILIDKLEEVAERWKVVAGVVSPHGVQVYLGRLRLMEQPEPGFMARSRQLLTRLGISAADAQSLVGASRGKPVLSGSRQQLSIAWCHCSCMLWRGSNPHEVRRSPPTAAAQGAGLAQKGRVLVGSGTAGSKPSVSMALTPWS